MSKHRANRVPMTKPGGDPAAATKAIKDREAYHEAGHVVVNLFFRLPFIAVSLEKIHEIRGRYEVVMTEGVVFPEARIDALNEGLLAGKLDLREALAAVAGRVAEAMFIGRMDPAANGGAIEDMSGISECCRVALSPGKPIKEGLAAAPTLLEKEIIAALSQQALELLGKYWGHVETIARALLDRKKLSFTEAKELVKESGGGAA